MTELEQKIVQVLWDYGIYEDDYAGAAELAKEIAGLMDATQIAKRMIEEFEAFLDENYENDFVTMNTLDDLKHWLDNKEEE